MIENRSQNFIKVLHLCWEMAPRVTGGLGVACTGWVEALQGECDLRVIRADQWMQSMGLEFPSGYDVYAGCQGGDLWMMSKLFTAHVQQQAYEMGVTSGWVVHVHDWMTVEAGMILQERYGVKLVTHWHSTELERRGTQARNALFHLEKLAMERSDGIVAVSEVTAGVLRAEYRADEARLHVIYHGGLHRGEHIPKQKISENLLFAARLCEQKGAQFMMAVAARMMVERPRMRVLVAGDGELMPALRAEAGFRGWGQRISFLGQVPIVNMREVYEMASVLCLPSHAEPFGLVALEAAAVGVPVVLSENCGAAEVLGHAPRLRVGDTDAWCAAIHELFDDEEKYQMSARLGKEKAAKRTWRMAAEEMLKMYAELID